MNHTFTFNSKTNINGNRTNLVVNTSLRKYYKYGCHVMNKGFIVNNMTQKAIQYLVNDLISDGYLKTDSEEAQSW